MVDSRRGDVQIRDGGTICMHPDTGDVCEYVCAGLMLQDLRGRSRSKLTVVCRTCPRGHRHLDVIDRHMHKEHSDWYAQNGPLGHADLYQLLHIMGTSPDFKHPTSRKATTEEVLSPAFTAARISQVTSKTVAETACFAGGQVHQAAQPAGHGPH